MKDFLKKNWQEILLWTAVAVGLVFAFLLVSETKAERQRRRLYDEQHCVTWGFHPDSSVRRCACYDTELCAKHIQIPIEVAK